MRRVHFAMLLAICAAGLWAADNQISTRGRELYEKRCTGCHSLDGVKVGPPLRAVFGRRAAADPSFPYSEALKKSGLNWNETNLDRWLTDPEALVPDSDMAFRSNQAEERAAIIAYLKELPGKQVRR